MLSSEGFAANPFEKKARKKSVRNAHSFVLKRPHIPILEQQLKGTSWDCAIPHLSMIFTIAERFARYYGGSATNGNGIYDLLIQELFIKIPEIHANFLPERGNWRSFLSRSLSTFAIEIFRKEIKKPKELEIQLSREYFEDHSVKSDALIIFNKLTPIDQWFVMRRLADEMTIEEITTLYNKHKPFHERLSLPTLHRRITEAVMRLEELGKRMMK